MKFLKYQMYHSVFNWNYSCINSVDLFISLTFICFDTPEHHKCNHQSQIAASSQEIIKLSVFHTTH